jgi:hypothetical protein
MDKKQINELKKVIEEEEKNYDFNDFVFNYIDEDELKEVQDEDDLREYFFKINEDGEVTDTEIIYYSRAIDYLKENDSSLNESLKLAYEYGYELKDLNSEKLASLLASRINGDDYHEFIDNVLSMMEEVL